jgi:hypothetical protein
MKRLMYRLEPLVLRSVWNPDIELEMRFKEIGSGLSTFHI